MNPLPCAGNCATSVKRGKLCNQCQACENEKLLPNAGKGAVKTKSRRRWAFVPEQCLPEHCSV